MWRSSVVAASDIAQAVCPSRVDETSSSIPERSSSSECGRSSRLGDIGRDGSPQVPFVPTALVRPPTHPSH